jgi:nitroimidazol reductase NimA-like FMN-containing flavoprotein (pyridoxamine 5'-phosphate oxidase superfamily)
MRSTKMDQESKEVTAAEKLKAAGIEILEDAECREVLRAQRLCVLAMTDGYEPYAVPLFYGFDGESVWLGIAEGRKTQLIDRNPRVCVSVNAVGPGDAWRSVLVSGRAVWVTDAEQRAKGIQVLMEHNRRPDRPVAPAEEGAPAGRRHTGGRIVLIAESVITGRAKR